jgi:hypothetical protein
MSSETGISIILKPTTGFTCDDIIKYCQGLTEICFAGVYTDNFNFYETEDDTVSFNLYVRGFVQFFDIKTSAIDLFNQQEMTVSEVHFENLDYYIYGTMKYNDEEIQCYYLDEDDVKNVIQNDGLDFDEMYIELDELLKTKYQMTSF